MKIVCNDEYKIEYEEIYLEEVLYNSIEEPSYDKYISSKKENKNIIIESIYTKNEEIAFLTEINAINKKSHEIKKLLICAVYTISNIIIDDNCLLFTSDGCIYAINLTTNEILKNDLDLDYSLPIYPFKNGYIIVDNEIIYCLNKKLQLNWNFDVQDEIVKTEIDYSSQTLKIIGKNNNLFILNFNGTNLN